MVPRKDGGDPVAWLVIKWEAWLLIRTIIYIVLLKGKEEFLKTRLLNTWYKQCYHRKYRKLQIRLELFPDPSYNIIMSKFSSFLYQRQ